MKKLLAALLALAMLLPLAAAFAEDAQPTLTTDRVSFANQYRYRWSRVMSYYDNVYSYNHGEYLLTPFHSDVPAEYFVVDESGYIALAPIVLDVTEAMREALYGSDVGEVALYYGQFCEQVRSKDNRWAYTGVHEGIDFKYAPGAKLHAILGGVVTKAGDANGTVGIYNEELDCTLLYLHCEKISVKRGDTVEAGAVIGVEGDKKSGSAYTHVEFRTGRHTSSNKYRNSLLESDCPYATLQAALGVQDSGRQAKTQAAVLAAEELRRQAEAAAAAATPEPTAAAEPEFDIIELPGTQDGYGFSDTATPEPTAVPEATLPPAAP